MKRKTIISLLLTLTTLFAFANIPENYYSGADTKSGELLRTALNGCISTHSELSYDALEQHYLHTDFRPDSTLWDMYSTCEYYRTDAGGSQNDFCQHWNKEHTVCQSWFGAGAMGSDLFQVLPTDARVNNLRSNWPYGETASRNDLVSKGAPFALGHLGDSNFDGYTGVGTVYEPDDRYKGDIARIYFYMATCYLNQPLNGSYGSTMFTYSGGKTGLTPYSVALLMKWHRNDPVSVKEINRNDSVYKQQGNRNPFVDFPELAEYIWGNKQSTSFDLSTALSAYSSDYVPLDTEGSNNAVDYAKYGVTWSVNGNEIQTDSVFKNHRPKNLPATPVSCSTASNTFVGWSAATISGKTNTAPADLFTEAYDAPAIKNNTTFHAVFAHATQEQGIGSVTQTAEFSEAAGYKYDSKKEITGADAGKVHIAFAKAGASNFAKFFTELRCYGGSTITLSGATITKVEFVLASQDKGNALKPNTGEMDATGLIWTGNSSNIVFTVDGKSGFRALSAINVTYNDQTTVTIYSDYLTACGATETKAVESQKSHIESRKFIRDGQLFIEMNGHIYNIFGQEIL